MRGHENPALDVAITLAHHLHLPLLVYQGLSDNHPFANDRRHAFILQGAKDLHAELAAAGITSVLHVARRGHAGAHRGAHLKTLAASAAVVVTDDVPTAPTIHWRESLARSVNTPLICVDTSCVVAPQLVGRAYDRAFAYREATAWLYKSRVTRPWPLLRYTGGPSPISHLPFEPVDLNRLEIRDLLAASAIDHGVAPVPHTPGGSKAGYARWEAFKKQGLKRYADHRNDALKSGVSRMSAYLHYGMVSPLTIAREATAVGGTGAEKYLDELLIWRELAWCFCHFRPDHETLAAIPAWARHTLSAHESDPRTALHDWETLARARTADSLWNAAQISLLKQGELHNNVRMTWGKALPQWTANAEEALKLLIDLNHRYALDGCDPASYGGLLWCLGQFDRPFTPEEKILGGVRSRSSQEHARRLDPERYLEKTSRPLTPRPVRVAVVGAGIAGLMAARTLSDHGFEVTVFEKSRGLGGRMATRRLSDGGQFDHGCQYLTATTPHFQRYLDAWTAQGHLALWQGRIVTRDAAGAWLELPAHEPRYVGLPGMSSLARHLANGLTIHQEVQVQRVEQVQGQWKLHLPEGFPIRTECYDHLILAIPAPQAARLLADHPLAASLAKVPMSPCWTVMATLPTRWDLPFDGFRASAEDSPSLAVGWAGRDTSKPNRPTTADRWVLQATPAWTRTHLDLPAETVANRLWQEWCRFVDRPETSRPETPLPELLAHRWMFAAREETPPGESSFDPQIREELDTHQALHHTPTHVTACGDWAVGSRVESAFLSGLAAAGFVMRKELLTQPTPTTLF